MVNRRPAASAQRPAPAADNLPPWNPEPVQAAQAAPAAAAPAPTPTPDTSKTAFVTLANPIVRQGETITRLTLRKPLGGDLRGFTLQALMQSDINAIIAVVPRISQPFITEQEVAAFEADDIAEVGGALMGFFISKAQKEMILRMAGG